MTTHNLAFRFLELPQEVQDQVYECLYDHPLTFHVFAKRGQGRIALTYRLPNQPAAAQPKIDKASWQRRRQQDYSGGIRSATLNTTSELPSGSLSMLHVHPRIAAGATKYQYRLHTFRSESMCVLATFMDTIALASKTSTMRYPACRITDAVDTVFVRDLGDSYSTTNSAIHALTSFNEH